jgi:hypothetical protein
VITYAERECFSPVDLKLFARVQAIVARVSDAWGNELRCHELARAVQRVIGDSTIVVIDGHCGPVEHSWLRCGDGVIIDPYAPGRVPAVQIVDPLAGGYRPGVARSDIRRSMIKRLVNEMRDLPTQSVS